MGRLEKLEYQLDDLEAKRWKVEYFSTFCIYQTIGFTNWQRLLVSFSSIHKEDLVVFDPP